MADGCGASPVLCAWAGDGEDCPQKTQKTQNSVGRQGGLMGWASPVLCAWAGDGEAVLSAVLPVEVFLVDGIE